MALGTQRRRIRLPAMDGRRLASELVAFARGTALRKRLHRRRAPLEEIAEEMTHVGDVNHRVSVRIRGGEARQGAPAKETRQQAARIGYVDGGIIVAISAEKPRSFPAAISFDLLEDVVPRSGRAT